MKTSTIKKLVLTLLFSASFFSLNANDKFVASNNQNLAVEYTLENSSKEIDKAFFQFTKDIEKIGFFVNDAHHNVQNVYEKKVGETSLSQLSFSSLINDDKARKLFNIDPRLGGFTPFNLVIYRRKSDNKSVITHITPEAALDILQIRDNHLREKFIEMFKPMDELIEKTFNVKKTYTKIHGFAKQSMMNYEITFEKPEDIDDFFDEFQEELEAPFEKKGYIIAGFYDMKYSFNTEKDELPNFEKYIVWSLCHISFSYTIFDGKEPLPQAAIFAPCSMYAYIKKGENKIVIGMPTLSAWAASLNITQKDKLQKIKQLDSEITNILIELGGVKVENTNPLQK
ncbi:hypothetical protein [Sulfurimonas sp.]|uniref:hypothetical protein n=1 Tax=Sulfurimonas sp. TaxID=2022749 RepID=UPI0025DDA817|nr:hypothetical protein [Sulfurimonas sp.]